MIKKLLASVFLCFSFSLFAQCPPGDLAFSSQAEVDAFAVNFPDCEILNGNLYISGNDITDLSPLQNISIVPGDDVTISNNPILETLTGLEGLTSVTRGLIIQDNPMLVSIEALSNISTLIDGWIYVMDNPNLESLVGLQNISDILIDDIWVINNDALTNLEGLNGLVFSDDAIIKDNDALVSLTGLDNFETTGQFIIENNSSLQSLNGLSPFIEIGGLYLYENAILTDISAISTATFTSIGVGEISNNPQLSMCSIQSICEALDDSNDLIAESNAPGCNSFLEVLSNCGNTCPPGDIAFSSQAEIDAFVTQFPDCTELSGLSIGGGGDITDLSGLQNITTISGNHGLHIGNNPILESLDGLEGLTSIAHALTITSNPTLMNIQALSNISTFFDGYYITIQDNPNLESLMGLQNISDPLIAELAIINNDALTSLEGLNGLTYAEDTVINDNDALEDLQGLDNFIFPATFFIENNNALQSLNGISADMEIGGMVVDGNPLLTDISSLAAVDFFSGTVGVFSNNAQLSNCSIQTICDAINDNGYFVAENNAPGCNSVEEVIANCGDYTNTTTFTAGTWSNGAPDTDVFAIVAEDYNTAIDGNIVANQLLVEMGSTLTVAPNTYIDIENNITAEGVIIVNHEGTVVQRNELAHTFNEGAITVEKQSPVLGNRGFMIIGAPMNGETQLSAHGSAIQFRKHITENFTPNPDVAAAFPSAENFADDNGDNWMQYEGALSSGEGYLLMPQSEPTIATSSSYLFQYQEGTLANGSISFDVVYNGTQNASPNILANPYASAIDADLFLTENGMVDALYFWEHLSEPTETYPGYNPNNYSMGDISIYTAMGGVAAANGGEVPSNIVASGQGFGVKATTAGIATFTNNMRVTGPNDAYRSPSEQAERIWLEVRETVYDLGSNILIGFMEGLTEGYDAGFDADRLPTPISLYSILDKKELAIDARGLLSIENVIPLGFSTQIEESREYTISIQNMEGIAMTQAEVYLLDSYEDVSVLLNETDYTFKAANSLYNDRFFLFIKAPTLSGPIDISQQNVSIFPNPASNQLNIILNENLKLKRLWLYSILGKKVLTSESSEIDLSSLQSGVYFIRIETDSGTITKKLVKD